jgi:hypothetical protein
MHLHRNEEEHFVVLAGTYRILIEQSMFDAPVGTGVTAGSFGRSGGFAGHGLAPQEGSKFAPHYSYRGYYWYGATYSYGDSYWYDYPYYD